MLHPPYECGLITKMCLLPSILVGWQHISPIPRLYDRKALWKFFKMLVMAAILSNLAGRRYLLRKAITCYRIKSNIAENNHVLRKAIICCGRQSHVAKGNHVLWKAITYCERQSPIAKSNYVLQKTNTCSRKRSPETDYVFQEAILCSEKQWCVPKDERVF